MEHVYLVSRGRNIFALHAIGVFASYDGASKFAEVYRNNFGGLWIFNVDVFDSSECCDIEYWVTADGTNILSIEKHKVHHDDKL